MLKKLTFSAVLLLSFSISAANPAQCLQPNEPCGTPKGINPGRVVWAHAPGTFSAPAFSGDWMNPQYTSQANCDEMIRSAICGLTGCRSPREAWQMLVEYHNGGTPYKKGEKIAIKINNNNTSGHADSGEVNASPAMVLALLRSLINDGGFAQTDVTLAEPSRFITDAVYNLCHSEFPEVNYVDNSGGDGRIKVRFKADAMSYSKPNGQLARGIATCFTDADYVINMALLKGHNGQGVTLCAKNWYGAMSLDADWRKNFHNNFDQDRNGNAKYLTFVDFMGHKDLGGKCILYLIDGLSGCKTVNGKPGPKWNMAPFDGDWPNSLFASQDPVAIDMVGVDFLTSEFPTAADMAYSDMYLMEAACADHAPSGTVYMPNGADSPLQSLGVAEHWNNSTDKSYTAIQLVYLPIENKGDDVYKPMAEDFLNLLEDNGIIRASSESDMRIELDLFADDGKRLLHSEGKGVVELPLTGLREGVYLVKSKCGENNVKSLKISI